MPDMQEYIAEPAAEAAPSTEVATETVAAETAIETPAPSSEQGAEEVAPEVGTAAPTFTVKVDGEEFQVTMEEALNGYQRQADYTRGKQALATEREQTARAQQLWDAIENNPQQTIAAIAEAYGFKLTPAQAAAAEAQRQEGTGTGDPFEDAFAEGSQAPAQDPRLDRIEQFMEDQRVRDAQVEVASEIAAVKAKYSVPTLDDGVLLQYAIDNDIGSLDAAFRAMSFEAAQQAAVRARKGAAKKGLSPVADGHGVQAGVLQAGSGAKFPTIEEAFDIAFAEANG